IDWDTVQLASAICEHGPIPRNFVENRGIGSRHSPVYLAGKRLESRCYASCQFNLWPVILINISAHNIDMNEISLPALIPQTRFVFDWVVPDSNNEVSRIKEFVSQLSAEQADSAAEIIKQVSRLIKFTASVIAPESAGPTLADGVGVRTSPAALPFPISFSC